jgi:hypothetical protein
MNEGNRQTCETQRQEEPQADRRALPHDAAEKRRHRNVDRERAHHVVEMPVRLGLQGV